MFRRYMGAMLVMFLVGGLALAGEYTGLITKYEDGKITVRTFGKKGKGKEMTLKVTKDAKMTKAGKEKDDEPTKISAKQLNEAIEKGFEIKGKEIKGVIGRVTTKGEGADEEVIAIQIGGRGKGTKKKDAE